MYFLEQIKHQFMSNIVNYDIEAWAAAEVDSTAEKQSEGPMTSGEANDLSVDAHDTSKSMRTESVKLQTGVDTLTGWEWDDSMDGNEGGDKIGWNDTNTEHPDSIGTPTMENVQTVAERNGMIGTWEEEPPVWEDGQEVSVPEISPEEVERRTTSLESDRARTQETIARYPQWSPKRQAAETEMSAIQMLLNIIEHGSINPPAWAVDGQWNPLEWWNSYSWGVGQPLSTEMLAKYWGTWHELASWLQQRWYPVFEWQPNYCGKNVGEAMNAFWYKWLPNSGRNGADWKAICEQRPNQFKKIDCTPQNAPAGALISYARNSGGSAARQASGHIEIALWEWKWYYYGAVASQPGGSQKPPRPWSYTIFMPTSKTA